MKKLSLILVFCMLVGLLTGCGEIQTEEYVLECGVSLTALSGLKETVQEPFTTTLQSRKVMIMLLDEHKTTLGVTDMTLEGYGAMVVSGNGMEQGFEKNEAGVLTSAYTRDGYFYHLSIHESGTSFWLIQMACAETDAETYRSLFDQWCATVELQDTQSVEVSQVQEKSYTLSCGVELTLPDDMAEATLEGYTAFLHNNLLGCILMREDKPEGWDLNAYAEALSAGYGLNPLEANAFGIPATEYTADNEGIEYYYYLTVYESEDAFWLCQIFCINTMMDTYGPSIPAWASSLTFTE